MNAIALPAYVPALYQQLPSIWTEQPLSLALGPDTAQRNASALAAARHYSSRPTIIYLVAEFEDLTYDHVPLAQTRTIKTRYRFVGRLPARRLPSDD
jgi:hypothetical protein